MNECPKTSTDHELVFEEHHSSVKFT